jgi:hypothetical protein
MSEDGYNLVTAWKSLAALWQDFFHRPRDARPAAAVRIALAAVLLANLAGLYPDLELWFTDGGILPAAAAKEVNNQFAWSLLWHVPATSAAIHVCFWLLAAHTVLLLVGLLSRINAACALVWLISFHNRNPLILDGEDTVMRLILLYLVLMPCGASWSIDAWLARRLGSNRDSGHLRPAWGLRLLQIQMALIFFTAGLHKLATEQWFGGTAMYYVARLDDYFGKYPTPTWLFDTPWSVAVMSWSVVLAELLIPIFIWFRQTRRLCLLVAVLFHLANEWTMHLFLFHWAMLAGWLAFMEPADFSWLMLRRETGGQWSDRE